SGLAKRGFGAGDRLAVLGDNRPRLYAAMLAAQSLGGIGVPLWPDADPTAIAATLADACVRIAVAEDQEQVAKLRTARASLPDLAWVVSLDPRALHGDDQAWLVGFDELCQQGAATDGAKASTVDGKADDVALLLPRSGQPAVMLRHANLVAAARAIADVEDV